MALTDTSNAASLRIAVLIDCDNVSPTHAADILEELVAYGIPTIKRAYGDWTTTHLGGWKKALNDLAIQPVQQFAYTYGKNSTDSALIIDAMDLLWMGHVDAFALVSSDSDFTRLATRLRESGKRVIGLGERKTPASLRNAVDQFIYLELIGQQDEDQPDGAAPAGAAGTGAKGSANGGTAAAASSGTETSDAASEPATSGEDPTPPDVRSGGRRQRHSGAPLGISAADADTNDDGEGPRINLQSALVKAVNATSTDDGWANLGPIGQYLSRTHVDFDPRDFGHQKLSTLVAEQPYLQTRAAGRSLEVSLKQRRKAQG